MLLPVRLSEQNKLASEQKRLVAEIGDKLQEYQEWNVKYNVSNTIRIAGVYSSHVALPQGYQFLKTESGTAWMKVSFLLMFGEINKDRASCRTGLCVRKLHDHTYTSVQISW